MSGINVLAKCQECGAVFILMFILFAFMFIVYLIGKWVERFKNKDSRTAEVSKKVIELKTEVDLIYRILGGEKIAPSNGHSEPFQGDVNNIVAKVELQFACHIGSKEEAKSFLEDELFSSAIVKLNSVEILQGTVYGNGVKF